MLNSKFTASKVTIAIPTFNRAELLRSSLKSALDQHYDALEVLVLDNSSTDNTEAVVKSFDDVRIKYVKSQRNIGIFRNWNRALELNSSSYLAILGDDDVLLPEFVKESVVALENNPSAALAFGIVNGVDLKDEETRLPGDWPAPGFMLGTEYLFHIVNGANWVMRTSAVLMRACVIEQVGPFDTAHSGTMIDINLYYRMMRSYDVVFISKLLARVRVHSGQDTQRTFRSLSGIGPLATLAERMECVAHLLRSDRAREASFRQWLGERLSYLNMRRSELTHKFVPELSLSSAERLEIARDEMVALIGAARTFILVDEGEWGSEIAPDHRAIPFLEREGVYWGVPPDDRTAIQELERLRVDGAEFAVFGWPAFWWLDYFSGLREHLRMNYPCILSNSRLVVYALEKGQNKSKKWNQ